MKFTQILISEALELKEVISSRERVVFMQLRQSLVGVCLGQYPILVISVEEAGSYNLGKHHFCIVNEVKDTRIKDILNKIYHVDFTEGVQPRRFDKMLSCSDELT